MIKWIKWLMVLAVLATLGCGAKKPLQPLRVVDQITVTCDNCSSPTRRFYNTEEKMRLILYHLRSIGIRDTPDTDPDKLSATTIHITLTFSDGTTKIYNHKGDRYFREGSGPWTEISPEKVAGFYQLIMMMPSDEEEPHLYRPHPTAIPRFPGLTGQG